MAKLKSSPRNYYRRYYDLVDHYEIYVPQLTGYVSFVVYTIFLSTVITYHRMFKKSYTVGATTGAGSTYTYSKETTDTASSALWTYTSNLTTVVKSVLKFMINGTTSILES